MAYKTLRNIENLIYYDGPQIWIGEDPDGFRYLVFTVGVNEDDFPNKWVAVALSNILRELLESNDISLYAALKIGSASKLIQITEDEEYAFGDLKGTWTELFWNQLDLLDFPEQRQFLKI